MWTHCEWNVVDVFVGAFTQRDGRNTVGFRIIWMAILNCLFGSWDLPAIDNSNFMNKNPYQVTVCNVHFFILSVL